MSEKLKPCPFCVCDANVYKADNNKYFIVCEKEGCVDMGFIGDDINYESEGYYETEEEAIKAWNTRKDGGE